MLGQQVVALAAYLAHPIFKPIAAFFALQHAILAVELRWQTEQTGTNVAAHKQSIEATDASIHMSRGELFDGSSTRALGALEESVSYMALAASDEDGIGLIWDHVAKKDPFGAAATALVEALAVGHFDGVSALALPCFLHLAYIIMLSGRRIRVMEGFLGSFGAKNEGELGLDIVEEVDMELVE